MARDFRVLSIQSHVVSGYVGNKSASFPLQTLGFEVDLINSVQYSNHTGYPVFRGQTLSAEELQELYDGLKLNRINKYSHVLTGYTPTDTLLTKIVDIVTELKQNNPNLMYVCDPVMGDDGRLYVPAALLPIYRDQLLPLADVITPNHFELEQLTGRTIVSETDVLESMEDLHKKGAPIVILTSFSGPEEAKSKQIVLYGSSKKGGVRTAVRVEIPALEAKFTGTGDLLAACILAWITRTNNLKEALEKAVATVQGVLQKTYKYATEKDKDKEAKEGEDGLPSVQTLELRLVQSKEHIENPHSDIRALRIL